MTDPNGSNGSKGEGNTRPPPRCNPAKNWCFTWNNPPEDGSEVLCQRFQELGVSYIFEPEVGDSGTPHFQGFTRSEFKIRPTSFRLPKQIHWEVARGSVQQNVRYCSKDGAAIYSPDLRPPRQIKLIDPDKVEWQSNLVNILDQEPDDRTIYWYWDPIGNKGKSALAKWLCVKKDALIVAGKAADMKYAVAQKTQKSGYPNIIIMDLPRSMEQYTSYAGIEEIKNGCFCSTKYESGMVLGPCPHVVVFSNWEPDTSQMSEDRWVVKEIGDIILK